MSSWQVGKTRAEFYPIPALDLTTGLVGEERSKDSFFPSFPSGKKSGNFLPTKATRGLEDVFSHQQNGLIGVRANTQELLSGPDPWCRQARVQDVGAGRR